MFVPSSNSKQWYLECLDNSVSAIKRHNKSLQTNNIIVQNVTWGHVKNFVKNYVKWYSICQSNKLESLRPTDFLQPILISAKNF